MPSPHAKWTVLPHGRLTRVDDAVMTVVGDLKMPLAVIPRRMTLVRLGDGRLVVYSAISLNADGMKTVEAFGTPAFLVVPNAHHRLDAASWKWRYPLMKVVAPQGSRAAVEKVVPVDATDGDFGDPSVVFRAVAGTGAREAALEISGNKGMTLVLNDIVANIRGLTGVGGWMMRILGFAGDSPKVPRPVSIIMISDRKALAAQFRRWADLPLSRILVSHGAVIDRDTALVLRKLADSLE